MNWSALTETIDKAKIRPRISRWLHEETRLQVWVDNVGLYLELLKGAGFIAHTTNQGNKVVIEIQLKTKDIEVGVFLHWLKIHWENFQNVIVHTDFDQSSTLPEVIVFHNTDVTTYYVCREYEDEMYFDTQTGGYYELAFVDDVFYWVLTTFSV